MVLSNLQIEILRTFSKPLPEQQVLEIRQILADYFAKKIDDDVNKLFEEKSWNESTIDGWLKEHLRTPYQANQ